MQKIPIVKTKKIYLHTSSWSQVESLPLVNSVFMLIIGAWAEKKRTIILACWKKQWKKQLLAALVENFIFYRYISIMESTKSFFSYDKARSRFAETFGTYHLRAFVLSPREEPVSNSTVPIRDGGVDVTLSEPRKSILGVGIELETLQSEDCHHNHRATGTD